MMNFLGYACLFGLMLCASTLANMWSYKRGYLAGFTAGQEEERLVDRRAENDWWIQAEKGIDAERQKIWESET